MVRLRLAGLPAQLSAQLSAAVLVVAMLGGCSSDGSSSSSVATDASADPTALRVIAQFYPLAFVAERVGGERVAVTNVTPVGAEPHDIELTPGDAIELENADLVVALGGMSAAVDDGVAAFAAGHSFDVLTDAGVDSDDPHVWLDPLLLADIADALAQRLADLDADGADAFAAGAAGLRVELEALDGEYRAALAECTSRTIVTSHTAFGALAARYDLTQVGIAGLSPDEEPSARDLAEVAAFVEDNDVRTIYFEALVSPDLAETVASETGADVAMLDPIEGLADSTGDDDYLSLMRANLATLVDGQGCG